MLLRFISLLIVTLASSLFAGLYGLPKQAPSVASGIKSDLGVFANNRSIEPTPSEVESRLLRQIEPLIAQDPRAAIRRLQAIGNSFSGPIVPFLLGSLYLQENQLNQAERSLKQAVAIFPSFRRAHRNLAFLYYKKDDPVRAIPHWQKVLQLGGGDSTSFGLLAYGLLEQGSIEAALRAYENALIYDPQNADWLRGQANCLMRLGDWPRALGVLEALVALFPKDTSLVLSYAQTLVKMEQMEVAIATLEVLRLEPSPSREALLLLGDLYFNEELFDRASDAWLSVLSTNPDALSLEVWLQKIEVLAQQDQWKQAETLLRQMQRTWRSQNINQYPAFIRLKAKMDLANGIADRAVNALEKLIKIDPLDGTALLLLADHYAVNGAEENAVFLYERARGIAETEWSAIIGLARLKIAQGTLDQAIPLLRSAYQKRPTAALKTYLERVDSLSTFD